MDRKKHEPNSLMGKRATKEEILLTREAMFEKAESIGFSKHEILEMKKLFNIREEDGEN